jgi:hypothetical protein
MTDHPYHNDASQAERREIIQEPLTSGTLVRPVTVPIYPTLPASSPWAGDPVPQEPPLGRAIDAMDEQ